VSLLKKKAHIHRKTMKILDDNGDCLPTIQSIHQRLRAESASDYSKAAYASLLQVPTSEEAYGLGEALGQLLFIEKGKRGRGRPSDHKAGAGAALAFVADILDASKASRGRWVYRSLSAGSFTGEGIGYRAFKRAIEALNNAVLIQELPGFWTTQSAFGKLQKGHGKATRWSPTDKLYELCLGFGITPENTAQHFRFKLPPRPLVLKTSSVGSGHRKEAGRPVQFVSSSQTEKIEAEVREINRSLAHHEIRNATHRGFRRIFNKGDHPPTYQWNKGGRLYSMAQRAIRFRRKNSASS
jgi:hypothetical protein